MDETEVSSTPRSNLKRESLESVFEGSTSQMYIRTGIDDAPNSIEGVVDVERNEVYVMEKEITAVTTPFQKRAKKRTSNVWDHFTTVTLPDGRKKNKCNHCNSLMSFMLDGCTSHMKHHSCLKKQELMRNQQRLQFPSNNTKSEVTNLTNGKYDHGKQRRATAIWILIEEKPLNACEEEGYIIMMKANLPLYQKIDRKQAIDDCFAVYKMEKESLKILLKGIKKVSLTTDLWTSKVQQKSYMGVTGHFIDKDWKLQKRVLNFIELPPPHGGVEICDALFNCLNSWGIEDKVYTISVDNASSNNKALELVAKSMVRKKKLLLEGKLFPVRCCAHILNLIVQDGLAEILSIIKDVQNSVRYINGAPSRLGKFVAIVKNMQLPVKKLMIDVKTRWNSTYLMLDTAYGVKDAFPIYMEKDPSFVTCPTMEDWRKVKQILQILAPIYEATQTISSSQYPTSNLFLIVVVNVMVALADYTNHSEAYVRSMIAKMQAKFDKYWEECNLVMAIGSILDPRRKIISLEFSFESLYPTTKVAKNIKSVRENLYDLFNEYLMVNEVEQGVRRSSSSSDTLSSSQTSSFGDTWSRFQNFVNRKQNIPPEKSELDIYLDEGLLICDDPFDVLGWWKENELKYPVLSRLACDMLAIPISTVASEATFSAGNRILDSYRANLLPNTVEMLICGGDWLRNKYGIVKKNSSLDKQPVVVYLESEEKEKNDE